MIYTACRPFYLVIELACILIESEALYHETLIYAFHISLLATDGIVIPMEQQNSKVNESSKYCTIVNCQHMYMYEGCSNCYVCMYLCILPH